MVHDPYASAPASPAQEEIHVTSLPFLDSDEEEVIAEEQIIQGRIAEQIEREQRLAKRHGRLHECRVFPGHQRNQSPYPSVTRSINPVAFAEEAANARGNSSTSTIPHTLRQHQSYCGPNPCTPCKSFRSYAEGKRNTDPKLLCLKDSRRRQQQPKKNKKTK